MDFAQHVGKGYGAEWRGVLFRETYPQLADIVSKTKKWFKQIFPGSKFNQSSYTWTFQTGEALLLRHMRVPDDYWNYHGFSFPWIAWEELTNWPTDQCYKVMMSCCRSTVQGIPRCYRATTNPYGMGTNWVKARFRLPHSRGKVIFDSVGLSGDVDPPRLAIHSTLKENIVLLEADPEYIYKVKSAARNKSELDAWVEGSWDIIAGGIFDDVWKARYNVVPAVPLSLLPKGWRLDSSFDWGSSAPFSVCWWAESNGEPLTYNGFQYGAIPGDIFMVQEWYGWSGNRNEGLRMLATDIAKGIVSREKKWGIHGRFQKGIADASIFDVENGQCIATDMQNNGVIWYPSDKSPGSRKHGWELIRKMLKGAQPSEYGMPRETPGLFFFDVCRQAIETLPVLPRSTKDLDDADTNGEDHIADAMRYRVRRKIRGAQQR